MARLTAIYRKQNGNVTSRKEDELSKAAYTKELRSNGFRVLAVLNDKEIRTIKSGRLSIAQQIKYLNIIDYVKQHL